MSVTETAKDEGRRTKDTEGESVIGKARAALWCVPVGLQLSVLYTLLFVVTLTLLGWVLYTQIDRFLVQNTAERLERTASTVLSRSFDFERGDPRGGEPRDGGRRPSIPVGQPPAPPDGGNMIERMAGQLVRELSAPDVTVAILSMQGKVITSTVTFEGIARSLPALPEGWLEGVAMPLVQDGPAAASQWVAGAAEGGRELVIVQAFNVFSPSTGRQTMLLLQSASMEGADAILGQLGLYLVLGVLVGTIAGVCVVLWLTRIVLKPLDKMARTAEAIAGGDLNRRLRLPAGGNEVARLGGAFDHMVDRLAANLQAQRRFVADASHELRTPLTSLEGLSEMLLMGADRGDGRAVQRMARSMHGEIGRMARLVSDLLTLSRLDSAAPMQMAAVDAGKLLDNIAEQVTPLAEAREVRLDVVREGNGPILVFADPDRLKQVVLNLVDNALRYTPAAGEVRLSTGHDATGNVRIEVRDTGPGIAPEDIPYIFDRFYRGDPSRARTTGSTGLGLAIARSILQAHGGTIEVQSAPGSGACFIVTLPAHHHHVEKPGETAMAAEAPPRTYSAAGTKV
jgi:two-component system OmpR family sensor kinase